MVNIFDFDDYREYLKSWFKGKQDLNKRFSHQVLANKAGFRDRGFIPAVIKGKKNLSKSSIYKISIALGHDSKEEEYFENLVGFNQAMDLDERNHFHKRIAAVKSKGRGSSEVRLLRQDQYEYLSEWYHVVVRSLISQFPFKGDYAWLAKNTFPAITPKQARKSVELLERLGLIKKIAAGQYRVTDKHLSTGRETRNLAALNFHSRMADLGKNAIHHLTREQRFLTGLTLGISRKSYERICEKLGTFVDEAREIAEKDEGSDSVFQMNFQLFPVSRTDIQRRI